MSCLHVWDSSELKAGLFMTVQSSMLATVGLLSGNFLIRNLPYKEGQYLAPVLRRLLLLYLPPRVFEASLVGL